MKAMPTLFCTSGAVQSLRDHEDPKKSLAPGFPVSYVLNMEKTFGNYTEGLIRASVLRCLRSDEAPSKKRRSHRDTLMTYATTIGQEALVGELMLAISRGVVLPPTFTIWQRLLSAFGREFASVSATVIDIRQ
jgi:hypothetical protein